MNKAYEILNLMKANNISPDNFTYSILIKGIKNSSDRNPRNLDKAFIYINELIASNITPDEILFNCLIDVCVKFNDLEKAKRAYKQMIDLGVIPSIYTFGILIKA